MENIILQLAKTNFLPIATWILASLILFLLVRELMLWYWKINKNSESLGRIADSLEVIANAVDFVATDIDKKNENKNKPIPSSISKENDAKKNINQAVVVDEIVNDEE